MHIITDGKWKQFKFRDEVPAKVLADQFSHLDEDTIDGFFKYRDWWYHTSDFVKSGVNGWDGAHGDSFFSGVLLKISSDGEKYKVGLAIS